MRKLKEEVYIATPEAPIKLWIVNEDDPDMSCGYIESTCKSDTMLLQTFIQKAGYKVVSSKPKNCVYARGIPLRVFLGKKTYAEFSTDKYNEAILETFKQVAKSLKIELKQTKQRGLAVQECKGEFSDTDYWKEHKNKTFKFKQGLKEAKGNKNDDNFSHAEHLDFETVKSMFKHPKKLAKYMFEHPGLLDVVQSKAFNYADEIGQQQGFEAYYPLWLKITQTGFDTIFNLTTLEDPNEEIDLYRGIVLFEVEPNLEEPGICWSYEEEGASDWVNELCIEDDPNEAPCILVGKTKIENVDWIITFLLLCASPEEKEIRIWDDSKVEITDWYVE